MKTMTRVGARGRKKGASRQQVVAVLREERGRTASESATAA